MERKPSLSPSSEEPLDLKSVSDLFSTQTTQSPPQRRTFQNVPTRTQSAVGTRHFDAFSTGVPARPRSVNEFSEKRRTVAAASASALFGGSSEDVFASIGSSVGSTASGASSSLHTSNSYPAQFPPSISHTPQYPPTGVSHTSTPSLYNHSASPAVFPAISAPSATASAAFFDAFGNRSQQATNPSFHTPNAPSHLSYNTPAYGAGDNRTQPVPVYQPPATQPPNHSYQPTSNPPAYSGNQSFYENYENSVFAAGGASTGSNALPQTMFDNQATPYTSQYHGKPTPPIPRTTHSTPPYNRGPIPAVQAMTVSRSPYPHHEPSPSPSPAHRVSTPPIPSSQQNSVHRAQNLNARGIGTTTLPHGHQPATHPILPSSTYHNQNTSTVPPHANMYAPAPFSQQPEVTQVGYYSAAPVDYSNATTVPGMELDVSSNIEYPNPAINTYSAPYSLENEYSGYEAPVDYTSGPHYYQGTEYPPQTYTNDTNYAQQETPTIHNDAAKTTSADPASFFDSFGGTAEPTYNDTAYLTTPATSAVTTNTQIASVDPLSFFDSFGPAKDANVAPDLFSSQAPSVSVPHVSKADAKQSIPSNSSPMVDDQLEITPKSFHVPHATLADERNIVDGKLSEFELPSSDSHVSIGDSSVSEKAIIPNVFDEKTDEATGVFADFGTLSIEKSNEGEWTSDVAGLKEQEGGVVPLILGDENANEQHEVQPVSTFGDRNENLAEEAVKPSIVPGSVNHADGDEQQNIPVNELDVQGGLDPIAEKVLPEEIKEHDKGQQYSPVVGLEETQEGEIPLVSEIDLLTENETAESLQDTEHVVAPGEASSEPVCEAAVETRDDSVVDGQNNDALPNISPKVSAIEESKLRNPLQLESERSQADVDASVSQTDHAQYPATDDYDAYAENHAEISDGVVGYTAEYTGVADGIDPTYGYESYDNVTGMQNTEGYGYTDYPGAVLNSDAINENYHYYDENGNYATATTTNQGDSSGYDYSLYAGGHGDGSVTHDQGAYDYAAYDTGNGNQGHQQNYDYNAFQNDGSGVLEDNNADQGTYDYAAYSNDATQIGNQQLGLGDVGGVVESAHGYPAYGGGDVATEQAVQNDYEYPTETGATNTAQVVHTGYDYSGYASTDVAQQVEYQGYDNTNVDQTGMYGDASGYYHFDPATGQYYMYNADQAQYGDNYETIGQQDGGGTQVPTEGISAEGDSALFSVDCAEATVEAAEDTSYGGNQSQVTHTTGANTGGYGEFSTPFGAYNEETDQYAIGDYAYNSEEYDPALQGHGTNCETDEYSDINAQADAHVSDEQYYGSSQPAAPPLPPIAQTNTGAIAVPLAAPTPLGVKDKRVQRSVSPLPVNPHANAYTPPPSAPHEDIEQEMLADLERIANVTSMEDPLNRKHGCPIVSFGFGGKMCLMFPRTVNRFSAESPTTGPITKVYPGDMVIQPVSAVVTRDTIGIPAHLGPLPMDGSRTIRDKKRKEAVEMAQKKAMDEREIAAIAKCAAVRRRHLAKEVLWRIIGLILEEGAGGKIEAAAQKILFEGLPPHKMASASASASASVKIPSRQLPLALTLPAAGTPISTDTYETLERYLLRGDRAAAVRLSSQHGMWAHALLIASCVSRDVFAKTAGRFIRNSLNDSPGGHEDVPGWDGMRLLYGLMGGMGPSAIEELLDPPLEAMESDLADDAAISELERETKEGGRRASDKEDNAAIKGSDANGTAEDQGKLESNFVDASALVGTSELRTGQDDQEKVAAEQQRKKRKENALSEWRRTVLLILANRPGDSAALTAYGNALRSAGMIEAAHVCYLLSPVTSHTGGLDNPKASLVLVGADHVSSPNFYKDPDALLGAEMLEFAYTFPATVGTNKGRDSPVAAGVIPHLQAYKVAHAWKLCEYGLLADALRYCEAALAAIRTAGGKLGPNSAPNSPYYNGAFLQALRDLHDRISQSNFVDSKEMSVGSEGHGGWLSLMAKPNFDSLLDVLDRGLNKFIAGEDETAARNNTASQAASGSLIHPTVPGNEIGAAGGRGFPMATGKTIQPPSELQQHQQHHQQQQPPSNGPLWGAQQQSQIQTPVQKTQNSPYAPAYPQYQQQRRSESPQKPYPYAQESHTSVAQTPSTPYGAAHNRNAAYGGHQETPFPVQQTPSVPKQDNAFGGQQQEGSSQEQQTSEFSQTYDQYNQPSEAPATFLNPWEEGDPYAQQEVPPTFYSQQPLQNTASWGGYNTDASEGPAMFDASADGTATEQSNIYAQQTSTYGGGGGNNAYHEEEDDLGFGNSSLTQKNRSFPGDGDAAGKENDQYSNAKGTGEENGSKPQISQSSYFGILKSFLPAISRKKDEVPSTPNSNSVRANLGEKSSFYYDETQKRWVNRADPSSSAANTPPPPPPPSRNQTPVMSRVGSPAIGKPAPPSPSPSPNFAGMNGGMGTPPLSHRNTPSPAPSHTSALGGRPKRGVRNRYVDLGPNLGANPP